MNRAYGLLFAAALAVALGLTVAARLPRRAPAHRRVAAAPAPVRVLELEVRDGVVAPDPVQVRKGERVRLQVRNAGGASVRLELAGYADRVTAPAIAPGATWTVDFEADLPGEDFAWQVDGRPAGRFGVTGSHLVEGHR